MDLLPLVHVCKSSFKAAFSSTSLTFFVSACNKIHVFTTSPFSTITVLSIPDDIDIIDICISSSFDGSDILMAISANHLYYWDLNNYKLIRTIELKDRNIKKAIFSNDIQILIDYENEDVSKGISNSPLDNPSSKDHQHYQGGIIKGNPTRINDNTWIKILPKNAIISISSDGFYTIISIGSDLYWIESKLLFNESVIQDQDKSNQDKNEKKSKGKNEKKLNSSNLNNNFHQWNHLKWRKPISNHKAFKSSSSDSDNSEYSIMLAIEGTGIIECTRLSLIKDDGKEDSLLNVNDHQKNSQVGWNDEFGKNNVNRIKRKNSTNHATNHSNIQIDTLSNPNVRSGINRVAYHWHVSSINFMEIYNENSFMITGGNEGVIVQWYLGMGKRRFYTECEEAIQKVILSPDMLLMIVITRSNLLFLVDLPNLDLLKRFEIPLEAPLLRHIKSESKEQEGKKKLKKINNENDGNDMEEDGNEVISHPNMADIKKNIPFSFSFEPFKCRNDFNVEPYHDCHSIVAWDSRFIALWDYKNLKYLWSMRASEIYSVRIIENDLIFIAKIKDNDTKIMNNLVIVMSLKENNIRKICRISDQETRNLSQLL